MGLGRKVKKERGNSNNVNGSLVGWLALTPEWFDVALPRRSNPNQIHICVLSKAETSTRWYMGCACCRYAPITVQTSIFAPKMTTKIKKSWRLNWHFGQTRERNSGEATAINQRWQLWYVPPIATIILYFDSSLSCLSLSRRSSHTSLARVYYQSPYSVLS